MLGSSPGFSTSSRTFQPLCPQCYETLIHNIDLCNCTPESFQEVCNSWRTSNEYTDHLLSCYPNVTILLVLIVTNYCDTLPTNRR